MATASPGDAASGPARQTDVAVIGGGIVGASLAYYLAKRGVQVTLLEKGRIGGEQSSRNWGAVRQQGRDPAELPLMMECNRIWRGLEQELQADLDWRQQGQMRLAYDEQALARAEAWMPIARAHNLDTRILTAREVSDLLPHYAGPGCVGGMFTASDGCAEPEKVAVAFAKAAVRQGAAVVEQCAVQGIDTRNGAACGVHTEKGHVGANAVVCASGAWTSRLLRPLGVAHPSLWVRGTAAQTEPLGIDIRKLVVWGKCAYRQRPDGSLTLAAAEDGYHDVMLDSLRYGRAFLGLARQNWRNLHFAVGMPLIQDMSGEFRSFTRHRTLDPAPDLPGLDRAAKAFALEYPSAPPIRLRRSWAGWIDYMPDELPVIDALASPRGLFVAAGLSGHGFGLGPIVGKTVAALILDGRSDHDLSSFRAGRFT